MKVYYLLMTMAATTVSLAGCTGQDLPVSEYVSVPSGGWNTADGREFRLFGEDSLAQPGRYDVMIAVRNGTSFHYRELWIEVEQTDLYGNRKVDTVRMEMTDSRGHFSGKGTYGLYENTHTLARGMVVPAGWQVAVRHIMNPPDIEGVNNIGIIAVRSKRSNNSHK